MFVSDRAFGLDEDNALLEYVKLQLLPPTTISGVDTLLSRIDTHEMPYERNIRMVFHRITCSSSLLKLLVDVGSKVSTIYILVSKMVVCVKVFCYSTFIHCTNPDFLIGPLDWTSLSWCNSRGENSTHHCHYTMASVHSDFDDLLTFICAVYSILIMKMLTHSLFLKSKFLTPHSAKPPTVLKFVLLCVTFHDHKGAGGGWGA